MISKHLKSFLIHLWNNKLYSAITILGFAISLMFILLLSVYIKNEYGVDEFHEKKDRIFRLTHGEEAGFAPPSGALLMETFPEVENFTRTKYFEAYLQANGSSKVADNILFADSSFFNIFSFGMIEGNPRTALKTIGSAVLSKSLALKLFGELPELGSKIKMNDETSLEVTGVMEDVPNNTHFKKFGMIINFPTMAKVFNDDTFLNKYSHNSYGLYVLTKPKTNLPSKSNEIFELYKGVNWMFKGGYAKSVELEPITESYFSTSHAYEVKNKSKRFVQVLTGIIFLILTLSVINYINLTIAQSSFRSREVAIRKLIGGKKPGLLAASLMESILLSLISSIIAIVLSFQVEPIFNHLLETNIQIINELNLSNLLIAIGFIVLIGVLSGIIPAIKISNFNPIDVVKGKFRMKEKNVYSKIMICFQYLIIITLIISAFFINKQTTFMQNYKMGFEQENLITFENELPKEKQRSFEEILRNIPGVEDVSLTCGTPLDGGNNNCFTEKGKQYSFQVFRVDTNFFEILDIPVSKTGTAYDKEAILINEAAAKILNIEENPGEYELFDVWPIYGVVKNFHFRNLKSRLGPAYFKILPKDEYAWSFVVKMNGVSNQETLQRIHKAHNDFTDGTPVKINFFNQAVQSWYEKEERTGKIVKYFAILTVIISVMGLFAMSLYYVQQKQKEIGVRKVNGAKTHEIMHMLNYDFSIWVLIAFAIACPISYYFMHKWLENFAYKTELSWWVFALAGILAFGIAFLTVSWQSWRAAKRNPVESLRYE